MPKYHCIAILCASLCGHHHLCPPISSTFCCLGTVSPFCVSQFISAVFHSNLNGTNIISLPFPSSHTVPPALPSNVRVSNITSSQVQVTWSLTHQHVDERAKSLMLIVQFSNGTIAQQYQLEGNATQQMVDTVPGMEYRVIISASNQDGTRTTDPVPFQTHPGRKHLHMWITV